MSTFSVLKISDPILQDQRNTDPKQNLTYFYKFDPTPYYVNTPKLCEQMIMPENY